MSGEEDIIEVVKTSEKARLLGTKLDHAGRLKQTRKRRLEIRMALQERESSTPSDKLLKSTVSTTS